MNHATHNMIVDLTCNIADNVPGDVYVRGKYRDVILPMTALRRLKAITVDILALENEIEGLPQCFVADTIDSVDIQDEMDR